MVRLDPEVPGEHAVSSVVDKVVAKGFCCGCGACVAACARDALIVAVDPVGQLVACASGDACNSCGSCLAVCPFGPKGDCEGSLAADLFADVPSDPIAGSVRASYVVAVSDGVSRRASASGGAATWILGQALRSGVIDKIVAVTPASLPFPHAFEIIDDVERLLTGRGSVYGQLSLSSVLGQVGADRSGARYGVACLPCQAKALRLLITQCDWARDRFPLVVGLVCGHQVTTDFSAFVAERSGSAGGRVVAFRDSAGSAHAGDSSMRVIEPGRDDRLIPFAEWAGPWAQGWFTLDACRWCEDVFAELADVTCMDAWLPEFQSDERGTSLVLCRTAETARMIDAGIERGELDGGSIGIDRVKASQSDAVRVKRRLVAQRMRRAEDGGHPHPPRRLLPASGDSWLDLREVTLRDAVSGASKSSWSMASDDRVGAVLREVADASRRLQRIQSVRAALHRIGHPIATARSAMRHARRMWGRR